MTTVNKLSRQNERFLCQIMEKVCRKDEDGYAVYEEGWDDERCRIELEKVVKQPISRHGVSGYRREIFGRFRVKAVAPEKAASASAVPADIEKLIMEEADKRFAVIEARLKAMIVEVEARLKTEIEKRDARIAELTHGLARVTVRMDDVEANHRRIVKRDEQRQTDLIGVYSRFGVIEARLGIKPPAPPPKDEPASTLLAEKLLPLRRGTK